MKSLIFISFIILSSILSYSQGVGINEDSSAADPSALLDVKSTTKGMLVPRMSTAERIILASPALGLLVYDNDTESFWFYKLAGWTELTGSGGSGTNYWDTDGVNIYNNNTGNVGIGINLPIAPLHIKKDLEGLRLEGTSSYISFYNDAGTSPKTFIQNTNDNFFLGTSTGNAAGIMQFYLNNSPKMTVLPGGNVGIGTAVPAEKLTVQTAGGTYGILQTDGITSVGTWIGTNTFYPGGWIGTKSNHPLNFFTGGSTAKMIILTNGNIGIGTDNPTYKLSVNGNIRSKEVVVETGWADYVFHEKYNLRSLYDVEKFILQNKHLPNIPSAREVEENGLHLGDTQKRMMEKIEELTLYVIELKKEIDLVKIPGNSKN